MNAPDEGVVSRRTRTYKISEVGRLVIEKFLDPEYSFVVRDLRSGDRAELTGTIGLAGDPNLPASVYIMVDLPAELLEEQP